MGTTTSTQVAIVTAARLPHTLTIIQNHPHMNQYKSNAGEHPKSSWNAVAGDLLVTSPQQYISMQDPMMSNMMASNRWREGGKCTPINPTSTTSCSQNRQSDPHAHGSRPESGYSKKKTTNQSLPLHGPNATHHQL
jgi:hypothetical protein